MLQLAAASLSGFTILRSRTRGRNALVTKKGVRARFAVRLPRFRRSAPSAILYTESRIAGTHDPWNIET